jgi:hypothetical protein
MNNIIQNINEQIIFSKEYLEEIQSELKESQNPISSLMLLDLLMSMIALDQEQDSDYQKWLHISEKYFFETFPPEDSVEYFKIQSIYHKYLFSVIKDTPDLNLAKSYSALIENDIQKTVKLTKSDSDLYERVVMILFEAKEFEKSHELCKKVLQVKNRSVLTTVLNFSFEKNTDNQELLIKKFKTILKRKEGDPYDEKYLYFSYYFREMLKINSSKEIFKTMFLGFD